MDDHFDNEEQNANNDDNGEGKEENILSSLQDNITSSAVSTTVELLSFLGGITLNTTGALVKPPLHVTQTVILPALLAVISDNIRSNTPQRAKDWFRILSTSLTHIVSVIKSTHRGEAWRKEVLTVGGDAIQVLSNDTTRQVLMDGMACFIKLVETLHTPEFKAFLDHLSIYGCRVVDMASQGKNKQLIHDLCGLAWSSIEMLADPASTVAIAEVGAYICHALEMEDAAKYTTSRIPTTNGTAAEAVAAKQRYQRNQQQYDTYQNPTTFQDRYATTEQVILSSLQEQQQPTQQTQQNQKDSTATPDAEKGMEVVSVPSSVSGNNHKNENENYQIQNIAAKTETNAPEGETTVANDGEGKDTGSQQKQQPHIADVDINYLRDQITKRSLSIEEQGLLRRTQQGDSSDCDNKNRNSNSHMKHDIEDLSELVEEEKEIKSNNKNGETSSDICQTSVKRQKQEVAFDRRKSKVLEEEEKKEESYVEDEQQQQAQESHSSKQQPLAGEKPVDQFYRILDEVLSKQRMEAVNRVLLGKDSTRNEKQRMQQHLLRQEQEQEQEQHKRGQDTIKRRLLRQQQKSVLLSEEERRNSKALAIGKLQIQNFMKEHKLLLFLVLSIVFFVFMVVSLFSVFGMYVFFFSSTPGMSLESIRLSFSPPSTPTPTIPTSIPAPLTEAISHHPFNGNNNDNHNQDIVIRIIREVVHVNENGDIIDSSIGNKKINTVLNDNIDNDDESINVDKLTECVTSSLS